MRKVAILGGTFDPVHWGHLLIAETALNQVPVEQILWVPTRYPSHKQAAIFEDRLEMVQRAIADHPAFTSSHNEANPHQPSYAIQTLLELKAVYPNTHWYWIVGLDAFQTLPQWYRRQDLVAECDWLVAPRFVSTTPELERSGGLVAQSQFTCKQVAQKLASEFITIRWQMLHMPWVGISSSLIRQYCRDGYSLRYLVPESVREYIITHNLYSD